MINFLLALSAVAVLSLVVLGRLGVATLVCVTVVRFRNVWCLSGLMLFRTISRQSYIFSVWKAVRARKISQVSRIFFTFELHRCHLCAEHSLWDKHEW